MMDKFRLRLIAFMSGRYGMDRLGTVILWVCIGIAVINVFVSSIILYAIQTALVVWELFRFFSRNLTRRSAENAAFTGILDKFAAFFRLRHHMIRDRKTHVFKKCPHCKAMLRLPKTKGHHTVRCPRCSNRFVVDI